MSYFYFCFIFLLGFHLCFVVSQLSCLFGLFPCFAPLPFRFIFIDIDALKTASVLGLINGSYCVYRIGIDEWLRVPSMEDVFAIGDCSGFVESTGKPALPALAQVRFELNPFLDARLFLKSATLFPFKDGFTPKHIISTV